MGDRLIFLDTNILVYLFDNDAPEKQQLAKELFLGKDRLCISTQVLQEFYVTVVRKLARPLTPQTAHNAVQRLMRLPVETVRPQTVSHAIHRSIGSKISFWDALIVETALQASAEILFTEDLHDGWSIGGMRILNPFTSSADET